MFVLFLSSMFYFAKNKSIIDRKIFGNALEKGKGFDVGKYFSTHFLVGVELRDAHTRTDVLARVLRTPRAGYKGYGVQRVP